MRKRKHKGLTVSNFPVLVVVFKSHHGSEGVLELSPFVSRKLAKRAEFRRPNSNTADRTISLEAESHRPSEVVVPLGIVSRKKKKKKRKEEEDL